MYLHYLINDPYILKGDSKMSIPFPLTMNFAYIDDELVSPFAHEENEINYITASKNSDYGVTQLFFEDDPKYDVND